MDDQTVNDLKLKLDSTIDDVIEEIFSAHEKHGTFNSAHELYGVLLEEMDEFWDSVKINDPDYKELIQVAATAIRGAIMVTDQAWEKARKRWRPPIKEDQDE